MFEIAPYFKIKRGTYYGQIGSTVIHNAKI